MNILYATFQPEPSQAQDSIGYLLQETETEVIRPKETNNEEIDHILTLFFDFDYVRLDVFRKDGSRMVVWRED